MDDDEDYYEIPVSRNLDASGQSLVGWESSCVIARPVPPHINGTEMRRRKLVAALLDMTPLCRDLATAIVDLAHPLLPFEVPQIEFVDDNLQDDETLTVEDFLRLNPNLHREQGVIVLVKQLQDTVAQLQDKVARLETRVETLT